MGKNSKHRLCPALGRDITSADCGEGRHSRHPCPADCPHNPFAPERYDQLLAQEDRLDALTIRRLAQVNPADGRTIEAASRDKNGHALHATAVGVFFFRKDSVGETFAAHWAKAGFLELKNDERIIFRGKMQMRVALLEIQCVRDGQTVDARDLLDPAGSVLRLVDRSVAARAVRFSRVLTWIYPLPHFWRLSGTGVVLSDFSGLTPEEIVGEIVGHLGGPRETGAAQADWLAENFVRFDTALTATALERRRRMVAGLDVQFGSATYDLRAPLPECQKALRAAPEVGPDELSPAERAEGFSGALVWEDTTPAGRSTRFSGGLSVLGRVLWGPKSLRLEAMGAGRLARLRSAAEGILGRRISFVSERRDDLAARLAGQDPAVDLSLVPPRLLEETTRADFGSSRLPPPPKGVSMKEYMARLRLEQFREWIDEPVPALDGHTPRRAATDGQLRPRLVQLVKERVRQHDEENLESGRADDINPYLRELGLVELDFPPPPLRAVPETESAEEGESGEDGEDYGDDAAWEGREPLPVEEDRPEVPALTGPPLSVEQAKARIKAVLGQFPNVADAIDELELSGSTLLDDADLLAEEWMQPEEFNLLKLFLIQAWFALVPLGTLAPLLNYDAMEEDMGRVAKETVHLGDEATGARLEKLLDDCRQPHLLQVLLTGMMTAIDGLPENLRPDPQALYGLTLLLRAVLNELDSSLRRQD